MNAKPESFDSTFYQDLDFEHAYETLEGHDHFFTESLRGTVRQHQLRLDEATAHLNRAEELFRHHDINSENLRLYFLHRSECMALASVREAITRAEQPGPDEPATQAAVANADEAFRRLEGLGYAENDIRLWNLQNLHRTLHKAIRDDLNGAVEVLKTSSTKPATSSRSTTCWFTRWPAPSSDNSGRSRIHNVSSRTP